MSAVNITNVTVLDNPAAFLNPFQFEISYECLIPLADVPDLTETKQTQDNYRKWLQEQLQKMHQDRPNGPPLILLGPLSAVAGLILSITDLEWKLTYVGSAEDETYDQLLESVLVGPVNVGNYRFVFQADPPDPSKIRDEDIIGVTVLLLTCSYMGQEFIRVGYYVNNDYDDEQLREEPPPRVLIDRVQRNILADKPRVTKFPINYHPETNENSGEPPPSPDHSTAEQKAPDAPN